MNKKLKQIINNTFKNNMAIVTKFKVGQKVYFYDKSDNAIYHGKVTSINIQKTKKSTDITYDLDSNSYCGEYEEDGLFKNFKQAKEGLIEYVKSNYRDRLEKELADINELKREK